MKDNAKTGMLIGLIISGFILVAVIVVVAWVVFSGESIGEPTRATTDPGKLDVIKLPLDTSIITSMPSGGSGAAGLYADAFKLAKEGLEPEALVEQSKRVAEPEKHPRFKAVIEKVVAAADAGHEGDLNFDNVEPMSPIIDFYIAEMLKSVGRVTNKAALSYRADAKKDPSAKAKAEAHMRAAFILGHRLWTNGTYVSYKHAGMAIMAESIGNYQRHYSKDFFPDEVKVNALKTQYNENFMPAWLSWQEKEKIFRTVRPEPGDLHNLAENDKDRAWRIQGMQWLGMAKWASADGKQRKAIESYIAGKTSNSDPLMARAAGIAKDFSRLDVQSIKNVQD